MLRRAFPWILWCAALVLLFWNFAGSDILSDDATYSFRGFGWFDYMGGTNQTTPIQWFGSIPWWSNFSFHDAPPVVFAVQYMFFRLFGATAFAAKLPFVLAGVGTMFLIYRLFQKLRDKAHALFSVAFFATASYVVWATRVGYLEGIEMLFVIASFFFFAQYAQERRAWDALLFWLCAGLALGSKYTALFVVPACVLYALIWDRGIFRQKKFWLSGITFFAVLSPIIIYNWNIFVTRGHFDAALSTMVGMHPEDFRLISARAVSSQYWSNAVAIISTFFHAMSPPFFIAIALSLGSLALRGLRSGADAFERLLLSFIVTMACMFLFVGGQERMLTIFMPFFVCSLILFVGVLFKTASEKPFRRFRFLLIACFVIVFGWELIYNINTNIVVTPLGPSVLAYSPFRLQYLGFNQLDTYIDKNIFPDLPSRMRPTTLDDLGTTDLSASSKRAVVFFDETVNWFAYTWYIQRYQMYYHLPIVSFYNFYKSLPNDADPITYLRDGGAKEMYYLAGENDTVLDPIKKSSSARELETDFTHYLEQNGFLIDTINNSAGEIAFKVYHVVL